MARRVRKNSIRVAPPREAIAPQLFLNRELSWLEFNDRVLEEACDPQTPLAERFKFQAIVSSNLDEFFMVRVAGVKQQISGDVVEAGPDGLLPAEQLSSISHRAEAWVALGDLAARQGDDGQAARLYRNAAEALTEIRF